MEDGEGESGRSPYTKTTVLMEVHDWEVRGLSTGTPENNEGTGRSMISSQ